jgi:hypothetical protein
MRADGSQQIQAQTQPLDDALPSRMRLKIPGGLLPSAEPASQPPSPGPEREYHVQTCPGATSAPSLESVEVAPPRDAHTAHRRALEWAMLVAVLDSGIREDMWTLSLAPSFRAQQPNSGFLSSV